jgi:hypothetical protein
MKQRKMGKEKSVFIVLDPHFAGRVCEMMMMFAVDDPTQK